MADPNSTLDRSHIIVKTYINSLDPSINSGDGPAPLLTSPCSYALNAQAFYGSPTLHATFRDGTSNTIALAERYWFCGGSTVFVFTQMTPLDQFILPPTFADNGPNVPSMPARFNQNYPITQGNPPVSWGAYPGTFQVAPIPARTMCDPKLAQTPNLAGMSVGMADGSVRLLAAGIAPTTYWGLVTPAGGEVLGDW